MTSNSVIELADQKRELRPSSPLPVFEEPQHAELIRPELLERIAQGDQNAMSELYDRTSGAIFRLASRVLRDEGIAEEVLHDTYMQVWRKASDFSPERGTPTSWVFMIARSRAIDRLRARRAYQFEQTFDEVSEVALAVEANLEHSLIGRQSAEQLREALSELPVPQRQLIEMGFFQGLSHQEIAEKTGQPLGTVKTRIRSGIKRLRDFMARPTACGQPARAVSR